MGILFIVLSSLAPPAQEAGVAISADTAAPNASAMLDVQSPTVGDGKGLLIPRVTEAQRTTADVSLDGGLLDDAGALRGGAAAQGLLVYQTDETQGFYYNASTTVTPQWIYLGPGDGTVTNITAGAGLSGGAITTSGTISIADGGVTKDMIASVDASTLVSGTVPSARLNLTDADVPNDLTISAAGSVDASALTTGTVPSARLSLADSDVPDALTISGGTVNNTLIGVTIPTTGAFTSLTADTLDTGQGPNELYAMDQNVRTSDDVTFGQLAASTATISSVLTASTTTISGSLTAQRVVKIEDTVSPPDSVTDRLYNNGGGLYWNATQLDTPDPLPIRGAVVEVGDGATVSNDGVAVGVNANGQTYGSAIGYTANGSFNGVAVGYQSNGYDENVAVGRRANAYTGTGPYSGSVSIGYTANSYSGNGASAGGVAIGYMANARHNMNEDAAGAVAIGHMANAYVKGVAIGGSSAEFLGGELWDIPDYNIERASGYNQSVGVGYNAYGANYSVAIGYRTWADTNATAIGYRANAGTILPYTFAKGAYSRCLRYGEEWKGADSISENPSTLLLTGYNKFGYGQVDFYGQTTTALATEIFLNGVADKRFTLQDYSAVKFTAHVVAINTDTGDTSGWELSGTVKRRNGAATSLLVGAINTHASQTEGGLTTVPTIAADTTHGSLRIRVTGVNANTVQWNVALFYSETRE